MQYPALLVSMRFTNRRRRRRRHHHHHHNSVRHRLPKQCQSTCRVCQKIKYWQLWQHKLIYIPGTSATALPQRFPPKIHLTCSVNTTGISCKSHQPGYWNGSSSLGLNHNAEPIQKPQLPANRSDHRVSILPRVLAFALSSKELRHKLPKLDVKHRA